MLKQLQAKGFVAGVLVTILLSGTVFAAASSSVMREVFYGVNVVVNGVPQNFPADMQPFISDGRTYLPVRGIADALGIPVSWDGNTMTAYLGTSPQGEPLFAAVPAFEGNERRITTVTMLGESFPTAFSPSTQGTIFWNHRNLNGQFTTLTGTIGRVDGSGTRASSISFIGDGRVLASFVVDGNTHPTDISVDVSGVLILRIEIDHSGGGPARIAFANAMIQ